MLSDVTRSVIRSRPPGIPVASELPSPKISDFYHSYPLDFRVGLVLSLASKRGPPTPQSPPLFCLYSRGKVWALDALRLPGRRGTHFAVLNPRASRATPKQGTRDSGVWADDSDSETRTLRYGTWLRKSSTASGTPLSTEGHSVARLTPTQVAPA